MAVAARLVFDRFGELSALALEHAERAVRKAALDIQADAQQVVPVDTGALKNSIRTDFLEPLQAEVSANMDYAIYVEYGTRHMAAQPYMTPAAEHQRGPFLEAMREILGR